MLSCSLVMLALDTHMVAGAEDDDRKHARASEEINDVRRLCQPCSRAVLGEFYYYNRQ